MTTTVKRAPLSSDGNSAKVPSTSKKSHKPRQRRRHHPRMVTSVLRHGTSETRVFRMSLDDGSIQDIEVQTYQGGLSTRISGVNQPLSSDFTIPGVNMGIEDEFYIREPTTRALLYKNRTVLYFSSTAFGRITTRGDSTKIVSAESFCPRFPKFRLGKYPRTSAKLDARNMVRYRIEHGDGNAFEIQGTEMLAPEGETIYQVDGRKSEIHCPFYTSRLQDLVGVSVTGVSGSEVKGYYWIVYTYGKLSTMKELEHTFTLDDGTVYMLSFGGKFVLQVEVEALDIIQLGMGVVLVPKSDETEDQDTDVSNKPA